MGPHYRGDGTGRPDVPIPPARMPVLRDGRVRKHWRYAGVFSAGLSVCAAQVRVGPAVQEFWAVWDGLRLVERTRRVPGRVRVREDRVLVRDGATRIDLALGPAEPVEVVTPYAGAYAWTRKLGGGWARGTVVHDGRVLEVDGLAVYDESAGYPPRRTAWLWSAGAGRDTAGGVIAWNTTVGLHDLEPRTESTVWSGGVARSVPVGRIAPDLSGVAWDGASLAFAVGAVRRRSEDLLLVRSSYEQPFGAFTGTLPGGVEVAEAHGVMERHDALW